MGCKLLILMNRYSDVSARPHGISESLYDYVLQSKNPALDPDYLHRCARLWGRCYWRGQYPDQETADDMENYRGLELTHQMMNLRHKMWKVLLDDPGRLTDQADVLFKETMAIRDVSRHSLFLFVCLGANKHNRDTLIFS